VSSSFAFSFRVLSSDFLSLCPCVSSSLNDEKNKKDSSRRSFVAFVFKMRFHFLFSSFEVIVVEDVAFCVTFDGDEPGTVGETQRRRVQRLQCVFQPPLFPPSVLLSLCFSQDNGMLKKTSPLRESRARRIAMDRPSIGLWVSNLGQNRTSRASSTLSPSRWTKQTTCMVFFFFFFTCGGLTITSLQLLPVPGHL
jgi:hypothetical protein